MSSSGKKKFLVRHPVMVDLGCGCRRTKLSSLFSSAQPKSKLKPHSTPKHHHPLSSYYPFSPSTTTTTTTIATSPWETSRHPSSTSTTTTSFYDEDTSSPSSHHAAAWARSSKEPPKPQAGPPKKHAGGKQHQHQHQHRRGSKGGRVGESVAVVKESDDPYVDFRESMLQMILEKEIYAWDDLRELLNRFLALNSPYHHDVIVRAFAEIWNGVFSSSSSSSSFGATPSSSCATGAGAAYCKQGRPRGHHGGGARRRQLHMSRDT